MGEFTQGNIQHDRIKQDLNVSQTPPDSKQQTNAPDGKFKTEVYGIFADGEKSGFPVFDVEEDEFFNNMKHDRRRMRFKTDNIKNYMSSTKYRRPFWVRNKKDGFTYKVK